MFWLKVVVDQFGFQIFKAGDRKDRPIDVQSNISPSPLRLDLLAAEGFPYYRAVGLVNLGSLTHMVFDLHLIALLHLIKIWRAVHPACHSLLEYASSGRATSLHGLLAHLAVAVVHLHPSS